MNNFTGANQKSLRRGGFYWQDGKPYASVTTILQVISKPALQYWFGREVYRAMLADPSLDEKTALASPYRVSDSAKSRGSTVHSIIEAYKANQIVMEVLPPEFQGYANAFYKWIDVVKPEVLGQERSVISLIHGYAGTLDMYIKLGDEYYVVDAKTGKDIYPEAWLQTAAYKQALVEAGVPVHGTAVLLLKENGDYRFEHTLDCAKSFTAFLAAKTLWEGLNEELIKKLAL